jgi:bacterioferritin-associated ferredoxin
MSEAPAFVCRCEEIERAELERAVIAGARTINDLKRRTRAGMGACQGVYCLSHVASVLAEVSGQPIQSLNPMTSRPPARWISLESLAGLDSE